MTNEGFMICGVSQKTLITSLEVDMCQCLRESLCVCTSAEFVLIA